MLENTVVRRADACIQIMTSLPKTEPNMPINLIKIDVEVSFRLCHGEIFMEIV